MADRYRPARGRNHAPNNIDHYEPPPPPPPPYGGYPPPPPPPPARPALDRPSEFMPRDRYVPERRNDRARSPPPMRRFGDGRNQGSDFSFRPSNSHPSFPGDRSNDSYRPPPADYPARRRYNARDRNPQNSHNQRRNQGPRRDDRPYRPFKKPGASERALLHFDRGSTPPQLEGMNNGAEGGTKYLDFDALSDVEEQDMDQSDDEVQEPEVPKPKWSNAELYTALPPPDESQRNKKDMVKLIRKARIQQAQTNDSEKKVVANGDDFISLDMDGGDEEELIRPTTEQPGAQSLSQASDDMPQPEFKADAGSQEQASLRGAVQAAHDRADSDIEIVEVRHVDVTVASRLSGLKRKRSAIEDEEELLAGNIQPPSKTLKRGGKPSGSLLPEWQLSGTSFADRNVKAIPWQLGVVVDNPNPQTRLHQEIVDFYHFVQPKSYERAVREDLLHRLTLFMRRAEPAMDCEVQCFGSYALGIYLPDADMDVVVMSKSYRSRGVKMLCQSPNKMHKLAARMKGEGLAEDYEVIAHSKVPIIKLIDRQTSLKVDISFENPSGVEAIQTFASWKKQFPAMPILVTVIKQFLLMRGLNDVSVGGLGGFAVTCLVTSMLQNDPRIQQKKIRAEDHLGEMLLEFLDYYGSRFDRYNTAIRMNPPGLMPKQPIIRNGPISKARVERLMIIDPNNPVNDISGGSSDVALIFSKFRHARMELLKTLKNPRVHIKRSLIDWMLAGNYDPFLWYRRRLKQVYEQKWGPVPPEDPTAP